MYSLILQVDERVVNYEQRRSAGKCLYYVESLFMPRSPNVDESKTDVDIHIRRMLDPHTAADFFAAMEPKSWFDKILDWIKETAICKWVLSWSRQIFKPELSALLGSLAGKFIHEFG
jgi:hypothetical protein